MASTRQFNLDANTWQLIPSEAGDQAITIRTKSTAALHLYVGPDLAGQDTTEFITVPRHGCVIRSPLDSNDVVYVRADAATQVEVGIDIDLVSLMAA